MSFDVNNVGNYSIKTADLPITDRSDKNTKITPIFERSPERDEFVKIKKSTLAKLLAYYTAGVATISALLGSGYDANATRNSQPKPYNYSIESNSVINPLQKQKLQEQRETATAYRDGDIVYFMLNDGVKITASEFEKLFDVESGALAKYNKLDYTYDPNIIGENGELGGYTTNGHTLEAGDLVKVPIYKINYEKPEYDGGLEAFEPVSEDSVFIPSDSDLLK